MKSRQLFLGKCNLTLRIFMIFFIFALIFLLVLTAFYYYHEKQVLLENAIDHNLSLAYQTVAVFDSSLSQLDNLARTLGNSSLTSYLLQTQPEPSTQQEYLRRMSNLYDMIRTYTINNPHVHFTIFDADQIAPTISSNAAIDREYDFTTDEIFDAFQSVDRDMLIFYDNPQAYLTSDKESTTMTLAYCLRSVLTQATIGYMLLDIDSAYFQEILFSHDQSNLSALILIDEEGSYLDIIDSEDVRAALDIAKLPKNFTYFTQDPYIYFQCSSTFTGWTLLTVEDYNAVKSSIASPTTAFIVLLAIVPLLLFCISMVLSEYISKPIIALTESVRSVGDGNLDTVAQIYRYDELGFLAEQFNSMITKIKELIEKNNNEAYARQQAQIRELQNQINPHFLYNTLEMISSLSSGNESAPIRSICLHLSSMMRYNLRPERIVPFRDELAVAKDYLSIMRKRFNRRFSYEIIVDNENILDFEFGKFTLQPLIENAIKHGFKKMPNNGLVCISAGQREGCMYCIVHDNGSGMTEEKLKQLQSSLNAIDATSADLLSAYYHGIVSVYLRLLVLFGDRLTFQVDSSKHSGTTITILISENDENDTETAKGAS